MNIALEGIIGLDVTEKYVREQLSAAGGADIHATLSTPGGLVGEGLGIFNQLRNYPGKKTAVLSGFVMSMGTYLSTAFDEVAAEDNAIFMIHNVHGGVYGDHNAILRYGEVTKRMSKLIGKAYVTKTGMSADEIEKLMDGEAYFFGEDIVSAGFADMIIETGEEKDKDAAKATAMLALSNCNKKMQAEASAVHDDLTRAQALCRTIDQVATAAAKGAKAMDIKTLRAEHKDLVAQIEADARKGMVSQEDATTATSEAVTAEQGRCMGMATALLGEDAGTKLAAVVETDLTVEQVGKLGITIGAESTDTTQQQMLDAITSAGAKGLQPAKVSQSDDEERKALSSRLAELGSKKK